MQYRMPTFIYRCPATGLNVQGWIADDPSEDESSKYRAVTCLMCKQFHLVNPNTGKLSSEEDD
jgi:hypothetical protein